MRYDYNSVHGGIVSPRLNYKWSSPDKFTVIRLSAGNGFRVANVFTEDHAALTGAREVVFVDDLAPERSWNVNLNALRKIYTENGFYIALDASAFYTHFSNRIIPDYESNPNLIQYANLDGYAVSKGVSLNTELSWPFGLVMNAGATLMDVSITEEGETFRQLLTERFTAVWSVRYTIPGTGVNLDYTGNLYSPMRLPLLGSLDPRDEYSPWFSIQNIQISKSWGNWEVYGGIKNLLNFTPPDNSIARPFDPFDQDVDFDENGQVIPTESNPYALTFDPTYVFAPNQGIRGFAGVRFIVK
jgi:outer membrane receptor for ferrienterochelin and colicins